MPEESEPISPEGIILVETPGINHVNENGDLVNDESGNIIFFGYSDAIEGEE